MYKMGQIQQTHSPLSVIRKTQTSGNLNLIHQLAAKLKPKWHRRDYSPLSRQKHSFSKNCPRSRWGCRPIMKYAPYYLPKVGFPRWSWCPEDPVRPGGYPDLSLLKGTLQEENARTARLVAHCKYLNKCSICWPSEELQCIHPSRSGPALPTTSGSPRPLSASVSSPQNKIESFLSRLPTRIGNHFNKSLACNRLWTRVQEST